MRPQHGGRGCGTKTDLSGMQGADGFSLKTKAGSFPLQPVRSETLAVPYSTVLNCAVSVDCSSRESCRKYSGSLPSSPILSPDSWLLAPVCSGAQLLLRFGGRPLLQFPNGPGLPGLGSG